MGQGRMTPVPERLVKCRDQIVHCAARQKKQPFTASNWNKWFGRLKCGLDTIADLNYIVHQFSIEGIDRLDLERIAQEAVKAPDLAHYRRLFLANAIVLKMKETPPV